MLTASRLKAHPDPTTTGGRPGVYTQPIDEAVAQMLEGRVGVVCLILGFAIQLAATLLPPGAHHWTTPLVVALVTIALARWVGVRWIEKQWPVLEEAVYKSPRITVILDREEALGRPRTQREWREIPTVTLFRKVFGPSANG
jgi:hypothetical protein